jgi:hypothetical protein
MLYGQNVAGRAGILRMPEIEIFDNSLAMSVYAWITLAVAALQIEAAAYVAWIMSRRLPVTIVRRAL